MNASYEWLRAFVPFDESASQLRDLITARVATVDEVVALRADLAPIVVARVVHEAPHPDSDHLHVTKVDAGTGELLDVVCGAPNVTAGKMYPFAPTGTVMPNGLKIERRKIRGAVSNGMLCSARELGLGENHEGILELDVEVAPGTPFLRAVGVGDARIVIDVLPNRPDLLSHRGIAREIAAATARPMALPEIDGANAAIPAPKRFRKAGNAGGIVLHLEDDRLARRFMGVVVRGVKVGPSPDWLVRRLEAVGSRSINNVVDASNYVLHELGQPTHAFDLAKFDAETTLPQRTLVVRTAQAGETIVTLDGVERALDPEMIVIADSRSPQAIAGVMGGQATEVSDSTTDILIEVASFDPARIRAARRRLGMSTDASYRFERGVDVELGPTALNRVARIVIAVAGGRVESPPVDILVADALRTPIVLRTSRVERVLGDRVSAGEIARLLRAIEFEADVEDGGAAVRVIAPSWRSDAVHEIDLIEEVARLRGYDALPTEIRPFRATNVPDDRQWVVADRVRAALVGAGLLEAKPLPFVRGADEGFVRVANPLAENEPYLRREVVDSLGRRAEFNLSRMEGNVRLFEIGSVWLPGEGAMPNEELHLGVVVMGRRQPAHWSDAKSAELEKGAAFDEWDAKWLAELATSAAYPRANVELRPAEAGAACLWDIVVDGVALGKVERATLDAPVWASSAYAIELSLGAIDASDVAPPREHAHREPEPALTVVPRYRPLPAMPAAEFDLALLLPGSVTAADVERTIRKAAGELLERLELFDQYTGKGVEGGTRSVAWRLTFRHPERTLRDKEIEGRRTRILSALEGELNVRQRSA